MAFKREETDFAVSPLLSVFAVAAAAAKKMGLADEPKIELHRLGPSSVVAILA